MTPHQIALNAKAIRSGAERLEAAGYTGDAHRFVESLLLDALADGFRPVDKPVPAKPERIATDAERQAALVKIRTNLADVRRKQQEVGK